MKPTKRALGRRRCDTCNRLHDGSSCHYDDQDHSHLIGSRAPKRSAHSARLHSLAQECASHAALFQRLFGASVEAATPVIPCRGSGPSTPFPLSSTKYATVAVQWEPVGVSASAGSTSGAGNASGVVTLASSAALRADSVAPSHLPSEPAEGVN
jgi:hypothetical protein